MFAKSDTMTKKEKKNYQKYIWVEKNVYCMFMPSGIFSNSESLAKSNTYFYSNIHQSSFESFWKSNKSMKLTIYFIEPFFSNNIMLFI